MAAIPKRAAKAEAALVGSAFDEAAVERAAAALAEDFAPITDMRASAGYRLKAAQNLLRRFHLENSGGDEAGDARAGARLMDETFIQDRSGAGTITSVPHEHPRHDDAIRGGVARADRA